MFSPELPSNEAIVDPVSRIYSYCVTEVQQGLLEAQTELSSGQPGTYNGDTLSSIIVDMAKEAARAGDTTQVETHIDTLLKLPDAGKPMYALRA